MILFPTIVKPPSGILTKSVTLSLHMFWPVHANSGKAAAPVAVWGPASAELISAISKVKKAMSEPVLETSKTVSELSKMKKDTSEPGLETSKTIPELSKLTKAMSKMVLETSKMKLETSKIILEDGFVVKNSQKPGFLRAAGRPLKADFNGTGSKRAV